MPARSITETSLIGNVARGALSRRSRIAPGSPDLVTLSGIAAYPGGSLG